MSLIQNEHWVYVSGYYRYIWWPMKVRSKEIEVKYAEISPGKFLGSHDISWNTFWCGYPLIENSTKIYSSAYEAVLWEFRIIWNYLKQNNVEQKVLDKVIKNVKEMQADHDEWIRLHFHIHYAIIKHSKVVEQAKKEPAKVNETEDKGQQFNVWDTVKCIDTWWLNSLFLWKQYTVEWIHTAAVGKNTYEQIRVYGLLYSTKYFILVS